MRLPPAPLALAAAAALCLCASGARAAAPDPPDSVRYQGVLLDDQGDPRTGSVGLTIRIYDAATGGTLLYKQEYPATPLTDGSFSVTLGPTGAATDAPSDPLTTSLVEVFTGDLTAGPDRFIDLTVDVDPVLARIQIVSSPLALRAESAATAETATTAVTALDVTSINGVSASVVSEIFEHVDFDGGPPSTDPSEGVGDTDLDGIANFVDSDNDNDGQSDSLEVLQGSDINLITPTVSGATPSSIGFASSETVTVTGTNFEPGITVVVGSQSPPPTSVTATSFDIEVGPQPPGDVDITVTRVNGEQDTRANAISFQPIDSSPHGVPNASLRVFDVAGSERPVIGHSNDNYYVDTSAGGDTIPETFVGINGVGTADYAFDSTGQLWGFHCGGNFPCDVQFANDPNADYVVTPAFVISASAAGVLFQAALGFAPGDEPVALYGRSQSGTVEISAIHDRDGDDLYTGTNEQVLFDTVETLTASRIAVDASARVAMLYNPTDAGTTTLRLAHDLNGDGDYADTVGGVLELRDLHTGSVACLDLGLDAAGHLGVIYAATGSGTATLLRDLDSNGDFQGAGESIALPGGSVTACALSTTATGGFAAVTNADAGLRILRDFDLDDDFTGPLEDFQENTLTGPGLAMALDADGENWIVTNTHIIPNF